ncbi:MAG: GGDEF domain-containing protein [Alicyclobacillaceae bacterium]|nr:GGDEF domain-containing protein [Alicyclobacillaceae bacterium]
MEATQQDITHVGVVQKIYKSYWWSIAFYSFAVLLYAAVDSGKRIFILEYVLGLTVLKLILLMLALELIRWQFSRWQTYICVLGGSIGVFFATSVLYQEPTASALLLIPIIVSVAFFRRKLVLFGALLSVINFWSIYFLEYRPHHIIGLSDIFTILSVLIVCTLTLLSVLARGQEVLRSLTASMNARQLLMTENEMMQRAVHTDPLTGISNRVKFTEHLNELVALSKSSQFVFHLAVIDIDHFKNINDTYGHIVGDEVLVQVARSLRQEFGGNYFVARYGGEEFVVLGMEITSDDFVTSMEHARLSLESMIFNSGIRVTISIGIHTYHTPEDAETAFQLADAALYNAKNAGRNRVVVC